MKREIKYRAIDEKTKKVVFEGTLSDVRNAAGRLHFTTWEWLEYTGRRDKNRKEIYERDVLFENDSFGGKKLEVFWDEKLSGFHCRRSLYHCPIPESKNIEVIGNGYEHPELLESN